MHFPSTNPIVFYVPPWHLLIFSINSPSKKRKFSQMISSTQTIIPPSIPSISFRNFPAFPSRETPAFHRFKKNPSLKSSRTPPKCSLSVAPKQLWTKPSPAEVSRTIMELSSVGSLSILSQEGWPLGVGVRFLVNPQGMPVLCLNNQNLDLSLDRRSTLHVQLEQCGSRTPQCTLLGNLNKPEDKLLLKNLNELWAKRFGDKLDEGLIYLLDVERLLQMENFREDGTWVTLSEYTSATPDPLRNCAEKIVNEMNDQHMEDVHRFCSIYADLGFQVTEAKMIWVDRLGFDVHVRLSQNDVYEVRIPFPREVTDERGVKSSFNCMSQLAWEVEKNYTVPDFEKVKNLKEISCALGAR